MNISSSGILKLQKLEGLSLKPYRDQGGLWTIGYGHLIQPGENYLMQGITDSQAHDLFVKDLVPFVARVNHYITAPLTQDQFDALVIWDFNTGRIHNSTLSKLINTGATMKDIVTFWLNNYVTASGVPSPGLQKRRAFEAWLYSGLKPKQKPTGLLLALAAIALYALFGTSHSQN